MNNTANKLLPARRVLERCCLLTQLASVKGRLKEFVHIWISFMSFVENEQKMYLKRFFLHFFNICII